MPNNVEIASAELRRVASLALLLCLVSLAPGCNPFSGSDPTPTPRPAATTPTAVQAISLLPSLEATVTPTSTSTATPTPTVITSVPITFESRPLAVMIDNSPSARPHSGLASADLIYEAVVEAGITRLMAIFGSGDSAVLGPVRSTRHYFVYWAYEHNAVLVHAGASPQGFDAIDNVGLDRLDSSMGEGFFWRINRPYAESWENLYTNLVKDREMMPNGTGQLGALRFKPSRGVDGNVLSVAVPYPNGYTVEYRYDKENGYYLRYMNGKPHADEQNGAQYRAVNVIIQWMKTWPIAGDDKGRMDMALVGEGSARYFLDGAAFEGKWRKASIHEPTEFLTASGEPIQLNKGQTWINVVPTGTEITAR